MAVLANTHDSLRFSLELATFESVPALGSMTRQQAAEQQAEPLPTPEARSPNRGAGGGAEAAPGLGLDGLLRQEGQGVLAVRPARPCSGSGPAMRTTWSRASRAWCATRSPASPTARSTPSSPCRSARPRAPRLPPRASTPSEIGLDLATVLNDAAGTGNEPGEALSPLRFTTGRPQVVAFGQGLRDELAVLEGTERGEKSPAPWAAP